MAGTVVVTEQRFSTIKRVKFVWTTSAGQAADGATTYYYAGEIIRVVQIPDAGGTQPTNAYDVTVVDDDGLDALFGLGADISNAAASQKRFSDGLGCVAESKLTLHVTNGGAAKGGQTIVYLR